MAKVLNESQLVEQIILFLEKSGYRVKREVPTMGQRADLVAVLDDTVTIIEAKINHKKKVLEQCAAHSIVADYICIAWGGKNVSPSLRKKAEELGYGIIHCPVMNSQCSWFIEPKANKNFWQPQRHDLIRKMENL